MTEKRKVLVAGAGAAGLIAAIAAAREGVDVIVLEKNSVCGKKLSMTGNGRCNLTNLNISYDDYNDSAKHRMKKWLNQFSAGQTMDFFSSLGLVTTSEDGYIYPITGQASSVVNALYKECERLSVSFCYNEQIKKVERLSGEQIKFLIKTNTSEYHANRVIIATGGLSGPASCMATGDGYYICTQLGMKKKDTFPALVPLLSKDESLPTESGVRAMATVSFMIGDGVFASEYGEVQITKKGISGIPIMQASGLVAEHISKNRPVTVSVNFFPGYSDEEFDALCEHMLNLPGERRLGDLLEGFCNSNINTMILERMKLSPSMKLKNVGNSMLLCVLRKYRDLRIEISGTEDYKKSQVTRGGISLGDLDDNLQCIRMEGVFVVGELCDVDGRCGGYNLQWAWTSGYIAGEAASCL